MAHIRGILFAVLCSAVADLTSAVLPSYIKVCKREQNTINACVKDNIKELPEYLKIGIPELNVPSLDPMHIDEVKLDVFQGVIKNVYLYGLSKLDFKKIDADLDAKIIKATVVASSVSFTGDCAIDTQIVSIPIKGSGPVSANLSNCEVDAVIKYKVTKRDGQEYLKFTSCSVVLRVGDYQIDLDALFNGNTALMDTMKTVIHQNKKDLLYIAMPILVETINKRVLDIANGIANSATYDEILPA